MKKTTLFFENTNNNHESTIKMEGPLMGLMLGAGEILKEVSKVVAKALYEEPEYMAIRIAGATIDMLTDEKKGEANE